MSYHMYWRKSRFPTSHVSIMDAIPSRKDIEDGTLVLVGARDEAPGAMKV